MIKRLGLGLVSALTVGVLTVAPVFAAVTPVPVSPGNTDEDTVFTASVGEAIRIYRATGEEVIGSSSDTLNYHPSSPLFNAYVVEYEEYGESAGECDDGPLAGCLASDDYISHIRYTWVAGEEYEHQPLYGNVGSGDVTDGFVTVLLANTLTILSLLGFALGIAWILKRTRRSTKSKV